MAAQQPNPRGMLLQQTARDTLRQQGGTFSVEAAACGNNGVAWVSTVASGSKANKLVPALFQLPAQSS